MFDEKIELRSEKVRKIIGTIPSSIKAFGIIIILIVLVVLISIGFIVKFPYKIECELFLKSNGNVISGLLYLPADMKNGFIKNQTLIVYHDHLFGMGKNNSFECQILSLSEKSVLKEDGMFLMAEFMLPNPFISSSGDSIVLIRNYSGKAVIFDNKRTYFERIFSINNFDKAKN